MFYAHNGLLLIAVATCCVIKINEIKIKKSLFCRGISQHTIFAKEKKKRFFFKEKSVLSSLNYGFLFM